MTNAFPIAGVIRSDEIYTLEAFEKLTGYGRAKRRTARKKGLKEIRDGKRKYIRGEDWFAYMDRLAKEQEKN